jgi:hypothetical protein
LKEVAAIGGAVALGKAIYDRVRSKSRGRVNQNRNRGRSVSSDDSYIPSRRQRYGHDDRGGSSESLNDYNRSREAEPAATGGATGAGNANTSNSTTDLETRYKQAKKNEIINTAFTTLATMNAMRGMYTSYSASKKRHALIQEGKINAEEAEKLKRKNLMQDAAAVGIAALSLNSAYGEWKGMQQIRKEKQELEERRSNPWQTPVQQQQGQQQFQQQSHVPDAAAPTYNNANSYKP